MQLDEKIVGDVHIAALIGRFDAYETPVVKQWFAEKFSAETAQLVVNLAEVHFIDSAGLAALVQAMKNAREGKGDLKLCALQQTTRVIFELTRMDKAFSIFESEAEAVAAFS